MSRSRNLGYGEGSIYQEGETGRWRGELRIGVKRRRVSAWTRREVVEKLDELRSLNAAGLMMGNNIRVGEWFDWYDGVVISTKNKSNAASYRWALKHCEPLRGHRLAELEVEHVEDLFRELARVKPQSAKTKGRGGQNCTGLSKSSLFRVKMVLGAALYEAERRDKVRRNVARLAYLPSAPVRKRVRRSLTAEQARKFLAAVKGKPDEALVLTSLMLGLRPGEIIGLPWKAVDLKEGTIEIRQSLKRQPDSSLVVGPPKVDSYRNLRLPIEVIDALKAHKAHQRRKELAAHVWDNRDGLVFTTSMGTPIDPSNLRRTISDLATLADVGHLAPNELRHSAASLLVEAGVPLQQVADMLGHKDIRMLAQTYRHKIQGVVDVTAGQARMLIG
jgi:integrase